MDHQTFALMQAMDQGVMMDFATKSVYTCWMTCYDEKLERAALCKGEGVEPTQQQITCQRRCMDRFFEVYSFLGNARERRELEAQQGLAPGSMSETY